MAKHLDIESDEAAELAAELAALTGEDLTEAVVRALRERVETARRDRPRPPRSEEEARRWVEKVQAITADIRAHWRGPMTSDHDWLYGEDGLPK